MFEFLAYIIFPPAAGVGAVLLLRRRRDDNPVDFGPWKLMAGIIGLATAASVVTIVWMLIADPTFGKFYGDRTINNLIADILMYPAMIFPGLYLGAAVTSAVTGVKRTNTFLITAILLVPVLGALWFLMILSYSCITTGSCL